MKGGKAVTNEEKTFIDVISTYISEKELNAAFDGIDFSELIKLSEIHKLTPLLYSVLKKNEAHLPDGVGEYLKKRSMVLGARVISQTDAYLKLLSSLNEIGLYPITVKGIVIRSLYPEPWVRPSSDEDLYINKEEKEKYEEALINLGFKKRVQNDEDDTVSAFCSDTSGLHLEVHTSLFPHFPSINEKMNALFEKSFERAVFTTAENQSIKTLCPTDHLIFLILHSFKHFIYCGFGIRQIADFAVFARHYRDEIDSDRVVSALKKVSALGFFDALLKICKEYFEIGKDELGFAAYEPKDCNTENLINDVMSGGIYGNSDIVRVHSSTITLSAADGKSTGALSALFPPYSIMKNRYSYVGKCPVLLPVSWVQRIITYIFGKNKGADNASQSLEIGAKRLAMLKQYGVISGGKK